jgi:hypothetical protein
MKSIRGYRGLLAIPGVCSLALALSLSNHAQERQSNQQTPPTNSPRAEGNIATQPSAEIGMLAKMLLGNWDVVAALEPSAPG